MAAMPAGRAVGGYGPSSVFAKQLAGRGRGTGRNAAKGAGRHAQDIGKVSSKAAPGKVVTRDKDIVKSPTSQAAAHDNDSEGDGGVMTCANRGLLQQMLHGVDAEDSPRENRSDGEVRAEFQMSLRQWQGVPSTPKFTQPQLATGVPTIASPTAASQPSIGIRSAIGNAVPQLSVRTGPGASQVRSGKSQGIATGPPQRAAVSSSAARPGSRGGSDAAILSNRVIASPSGTGRGKSVVANVGNKASYGQLAAQRGKGTPKGTGAVSPTGGSAPAAKPRSGPMAFDLLRKLVPPAVGPAAEGYASNAAGESEDGGDAFVMPDSDHLTDSDDKEPDETYQQTGRPAKENHQKTVVTPGCAVVTKDGIGVAGDKESAADFVERIKRQAGTDNVAGGSAAGAPTKVAAVQSVDEVSSKRASDSVTTSGADTTFGAVTSGKRARSSDPRQLGSGEEKRPVAQVRSRSSDPRVAVAAARAAAADHDDANDDGDDDADDDDSSGDNQVVTFQRGRADNWKSDVKSMVKDFARKERSDRGDRTVSRTERQSKLPPKVPCAPRPKSEAERGEVRSGGEARGGGEAHGDVHEGGQLFFSRKPREVDYTPVTVDQYKQKYANRDYSELKTLGPDLDDEGLLMKKAQQERTKQFSKAVQRINRNRSEASGVQPKQDAKAEAKPAALSRKKMQDYAKHNVPKPRARQEERPKDAMSGSEMKRSPTNTEKHRIDWEEIRAREQKHFQDKASVVEIKAFLALLPT